MIGCILLRKIYRRTKARYHLLRDIVSFMRKEIELNGFPSSLRDVSFLTRGFSSDKQVMYRHGLDGFPLPTYLSDFERLRTRRINGKYNYILDNKIAFSAVLANICRTPLNYGIISVKDKFMPLDAGSEHLHGQPLSDVLFSLPKPIVVKRVGGGGGKDIYVIDVENGIWMLNGKQSELQAICGVFSARRWLLCAHISQGEYSAALYPKTLNTIRIVTFSRTVNDLRIVFAVQRIGRSKSIPTDNFNRGGLCAPIDIETGELGQALYYSNDDAPVPCRNHPETNSPITGVVVPNWDLIKQKLLSICARCPGMSYVGWDVVHLGDDILILEGNSYPGVQVVQLHTPLLEIEGVAEFMGRFGVLRHSRVNAVEKKDA